MLAAGTQVVGGINPRKAGQTVELNGTGVPVFGTVADTMAATGADVSVIFVPAERTKDAVIEAIDAAIPLAVVITEGIPVHDSAEFWAYAIANGNATRIVGPNCPGIASPGKSNAGIIPADITSEGRIGLVSKSGTLTYQMMYELRDVGFSTAVGIGGDPVIGTTHIDCLKAFQDDPETDAIVMIGEIGGDAEERAADYIASTSPSRSSATWPASPRPRARRWATPAPSSPAPPVPPRPRRKPSKRPASASAAPPPRPPSWPAKPSKKPDPAPPAARLLLRAARRSHARRPGAPPHDHLPPLPG